MIDNLSFEDRKAVLAASSPFAFALGHDFFDAGDLVTHLYFIESGIVSAVAVMEDGRTVEAYMVGCEGVTSPTAAFAPAHTYSRLTCQAAGVARRVEAGRFRSLMEQRPALRETVAQYGATIQNELEQSAACNALHRADQRFAKWLLRSYDRVASDTLHLTQEYLASMLGSQRTTVNEVAQELQRLGAITYSRGRVTVVDRDVLERVACECYALGQRFTSVAPTPDDQTQRS
ncbi:MAG: Crp/Fnr family transcriptional regulator [Alphaproteobacteria bacterium]|nr:Crp/Fnr family transcriptional regulator [Alphaproteobacteria bacterium]MBU2378111.1 Crp/Fnr family transcriptional regulator [Alphaproteobacteria bacterium]